MRRVAPNSEFDHEHKTTDKHYGATLIEHGRAERLVQRASQLLHLARAATKGHAGF